MDPMRINWFTRIAAVLTENSDIPTDITFKFVECNDGDGEVSAQAMDGNGELSAQAMDGNDEVSAQSTDGIGEVSALSNDGEVAAHSNDGEVAAQFNDDREVVAQSNDGDVVAQSNDGDGEVAAQSNDGDGEVAAQSNDGDGEVAAQSNDGDGEVAAQSNEGDGEVAAQSNDGDGEVAAQSNHGDGEVAAQSNDGDWEVAAQSNDGDGEVAAQSNDGDWEVAAQSNDGDGEVAPQSNDRVHQVSAHKLILALVSPVFRKMFYVHNTVDMFAQEIIMEETTAPAFRIFIDAIYGVTRIQESLNGKSVDEIFAVLYLVTKYDIPELVLAVQETLSSFPLTVDTVLEVAADVMYYSSTFPEEANQLLLTCAKLLKAQLTHAQKVLRLIAENGDRLAIIHRLAVLIREITPPVETRGECGDSCACLTSSEDEDSEIDSDSEAEMPSLEQVQ